MSTITQYITPELIERFYAKVSKIPTETGCLEWMAYHNDRGYGVFGVGGKAVGAHRVAWELVNGPIPAGLFVRHFVCDNPRCCNPAHFRLGTAADNARDMMSKGRRRNAPNTTIPYERPNGPTIAERFYAKISTIPTENGCLEWTAGLRNGYGYFNPDGINVYAHRFAWELVNGPIPDGMYACHHCDNRKCCNLEHIFIGSPTDNAYDMIEKGRSVHVPNLGERNGNSKLTEKQVLDIRSPQYDDWSDRDVAERFGISRRLVCTIRNRSGWQHLDGSEDAPIGNRQPKGEQQKNAKLTENAVLEIRSGRFNGWTRTKIAKHFGVSRSVITNVINRKAWKHI